MPTLFRFVLAGVGINCCVQHRLGNLVDVCWLMIGAARPFSGDRPVSASIWGGEPNNERKRKKKQKKGATLWGEGYPLIRTLAAPRLRFTATILFYFVLHFFHLFILPLFFFFLCFFPVQFLACCCIPATTLFHDASLLSAFFSVSN